MGRSGADGDYVEDDEIKAAVAASKAKRAAAGDASAAAADEDGDMVRAAL